MKTMVGWISELDADRFMDMDNNGPISLRVNLTPDKMFSTDVPVTIWPTGGNLQSLSKDDIREIFLSSGFTVKEGCDDLKPYVYLSAERLIAEASSRSNDRIKELSAALETMIEKNISLQGFTDTETHEASLILYK